MGVGRVGSGELAVPWARDVGGAGRGEGWEKDGSLPAKMQIFRFDVVGWGLSVGNLVEVWAEGGEGKLGGA